MAKLSDYLKSYSLYTLPQHMISRAVFWASRQKSSLKNPIGRWFIKKFDVDMSQAKLPNIEQYASFNDFFTRELKDDARKIATASDALACPADGTISQLGTILHNKIYQAKGHEFTLQQLLGKQERLAQKFIDGKFATIYLSPADYHRVHMPIDGKLVSMTYIPGRLFSVAEHTVRTIKGIFAKNERLVCTFETAAGPVAVILVGAINVAAIETVWDGLITPTKERRIKTSHYKNRDVNLNKGAEMGRFNMGSTVILLTTAQVDLSAKLQSGDKVKMGQLIANIAKEKQ